ncbi:MAG: hypothetical protein KDB44_16885 [Mycobacterium sp.]|nr:hypothetical protein [Mycobacterium sp.]
MTKNIALASAAAAAFSAVALGLATPAIAAPTGNDNAADTIRALEAEGNRVIVNRQSDAPLSEASIVSVRPGSPIREWTWDLQRDDRILETVGHFIFVDVR